ncbi:docking domain of Afi1 for Arf3 in vesicle trafficking-domain-containing protein [Phyllosticta citribraziliensis]|uniref:Docking domain of Afi1 for Arf3 in vesicle trafficking-domain-containing protein n=1 Tax=Phyllosticta citribraziliensis TaxID=989973 RepID=A0ABR1LXK4_9PEZI
MASVGVHVQRPALHSSSSASTTHRKRPRQSSGSLSSFPPRSPSVVSRPPRSPVPPPFRDSNSLLSPKKSYGYSSDDARMHRPLRSQYPRNSPDNHVEYILVASFDIDRGSTMEHQYPGPISGDEHMLADLMLPDQAHMRSQDWTVFFLHKDTEAEEEAKEERREQRRQRRERKKRAQESGVAEPHGESDLGDDTEDESTDDEGFEGPPLIYVLNLVNTKQDQTVRRGAVCKAMAICTRHSFLHIYKPILLLALEEYFRAPVPETLASLYDSLNAMDLSLMPKLSFLERNILQASTVPDMFIEKFEQMIAQRQAEDANKSRLALAEGEPQESPMEQHQPTRYTLPRDTHEFESRVLYNGIPVPIKVPSAISPETVGDFSLIKLIQTFSTPHTASPQPFTLHPHLTTSGAYTHPIIVLVNALLTQKRIVFLGHNRPSGEVAEAVLAACALASGGLLRGFTRHAFPYTDLTKIDDLIKVPGFIAGVTNPAFAHKPEWWDLLCDLPSGRMKISHKIEGAGVTEGLLYFQQQQQSHLPPPVSSALKQGLDANLNMNMPSTSSKDTKDQDPTGDTQFMESLLAAIANRLGEGAIRSRWRDWVLKFTRIAAVFEETVYGASALHIGATTSTLSPTSSPAAEIERNAGGTFFPLLDPSVKGHGYVWATEAERMKEMAANVHRVEGWRNTRSYYSYVQDLARIWERQPIRNLDLLWLHDQLRETRVSHDQSASIYLALARSVEDAAKPTPEEARMLARATANGDSGGPGSPSTMVSPRSAPRGGNNNNNHNNSQTPNGGSNSPNSQAVNRMIAQAGSQRQYDTILQLLSVTPESNSGLFYLSLGLFHPRADVRNAVVALLDKVMEHPAGRHFWAGLGRFAKLAFFRIKREEVGGLGSIGAGAASSGEW